MRRKVLCYTAAAFLIMSSVTMPTLADNRDVSDTCSIMESQREEHALNCQQEISRIDAKESHQTYSFKYDSTEKLREYDSVTFTMKFSDGFHAEKLSCGQWKEHDGQISVFIDYGDSSGIGLYFSSQDVVDLSAYQNIKEIRLIPSDIENTGNYGFGNVCVEGTIVSSDTIKSVTADASYEGRYNEEGNRRYEMIDSGKLITQCQYYNLSQPQIVLSGADIPFGGTFNAVCENIAGNGNIAFDSYAIDVKCPSRAKIQMIQAPEFSNASCEIYINGTLRETSDGNISITEAVESLQIKVISDSMEFTQIKPLVIDMQDTGENASDEKVELKCTAIYGEDNETVSSDASAAVHFEGKPIIVEPSEPAQPDKPIQPSEPDDSSPTRPAKPSDSSTSNPSNGNGASSLPVDSSTAVPLPVTNVIDFTGMNIQGAVATGNKRSVYDFTSDESVQNESESLGDEESSNPLYELIDDGVSSNDEEDDEENSKGRVKSKTATVIEESEKSDSLIDRIINAIKNNRLVQILLIGGGVIIVALLALYFILRTPKGKH